MRNRILITGKDSYIGKSFIKWMSTYQPNVECVEVSLRNDNWKSMNFGKFDTVLHLAGIAHQKETKENRSSYFEINHELAIEVAKKAKNNSVKHFIFLSSMSVFGKKNGKIDDKTLECPTSYYGKSKLLAENDLIKLVDANFSVAIVRPPMVYGPGCNGNYVTLSKFAKITPLFPYANNQRSMIFIDNLCEFLRLIYLKRESGLYFPQNSEYVNTSNLVYHIASNRDKYIYLSPTLGKIIKSMKFNLIEKVLGDLFYDQNLSRYSGNYNIVSFEKSIKLTEKGQDCN